MLLARALEFDAFRMTEAADRSAMPAFAALVGMHSKDQLAELHLERLLNDATGSIIDLDRGGRPCGCAAHFQLWRF
jgi:hypothetical protein